MNRCCGLLAVVAACSACLAGEARFTVKPRVEKAPDGMKIAFAVADPTDVEVAVLDGAGRVVRHLAAGLLGRNAAAPLKPDSLAQSLVWDGKNDFGLDCLTDQAKGPFAVRVRLGLRFSFDATMFDDRQNLLGLNGLAAGPTGELFTRGGGGDGGMGPGTDFRIYSPQGKYLRTIAPCPAGLDFDRVAALGPFKIGQNDYLPRIHNLSRYCFYPADVHGPRLTQMDVGGDGVLFFLADGPRVCVLDGAGGVPAGWTFAGKGISPHDPKRPKGPDNVALDDAGFLAVGADGQRVFLSGVRARYAKSNLPGVFWTDAKDRGPVRLLAGSFEKSGPGPGEFNEPQGLASDGRGQLLVADRGNDRVVVLDEKDGRRLAEFPVPGADKVRVDRQTQAVYVLTFAKDKSDLIKLDNWKEHKEVARISLPAGGAGMAPFLAVSSAGPPVAWVGSNGYRGYTLLRIEDLGGKFGQPQEISPTPDNMLEDVFVDRARNEVYVYRGQNYWRFKDGDDRAEKVPINVHGNSGLQLQVAANGNIYGYAWADRLFRWDRNGKPLPFGDSGSNILKMPSTMTYQMRGMFIDQARDELWLIQPPAGRPSSTKPAHVVRVYDLEGKLKREVIARLGDGACGPRVDPAGNIYIGEAARPGAPDLPEFFKGKLPDMIVEPNKALLVPPEVQPYSWGYGSIVKFSPAGGEIAWPPGPADYAGNFKAWEGNVPAARPIEFFRQESEIRIGRAASKGVLWAHCGFYPAVTSQRCNCLAAYFDVDGFGRTFYPDGARCRVGVLDTNGNVIGHFGRYGNRDAQGKDDYIPLAMPIAVAVTDSFLYIGDINNHCLVRARAGWTAEETCPAK